MTAKISEVTSNGEITVLFNHPILNPEVFNQSRSLAETFYDKVTRSVSIIIKPGTVDQDLSNLNFTHKVTSIRNNTMKI